jgi:hypothetical protein
MVAMLSDDERENVVQGLILQAKSTRQAQRLVDEWPIVAVLPDWLFASLTEDDRARLAKLHVTAVPYSEHHGPGEAWNE